jgi:ABC-2 type transport system ATP-binding protein
MIELHGLTKHYGANVAVDDLTVTVQPGRITALIGPNGSGKTTTLRMVLQLTTPTRGTATTHGRCYGDLPNPMRQVGALLNPQAVDGSRRAYDHLLWAARGNGIPRRRVDEVLALVGLDRAAGWRMRVLSPGMRQRLGIAMTLLGDPEVLIYDDPIGGLDPAGIVWMRDLMRCLAGEGRTVLITSHLMSELAQITDHFVIICRGRLLADCGAEELTSTGSRQRSLVGCDDPGYLARRLTESGTRVRPGGGGTLVVSGVDGAEIHRLAMAFGVRLHELTPLRPSLEEVFLELTQDGIDGAA